MYNDEGDTNRKYNQRKEVIFSLEMGLEDTAIVSTLVNNLNTKIIKLIERRN